MVRKKREFAEVSGELMSKRNGTHGVEPVSARRILTVKGNIL